MSQTTIILGAILLLMFKEIFSFSRNIGARQSVSVTLDKIFDKKHYDARLRPNYEGKPIEVKVGFWILSIDSINVVDMEFTIDLFLRQEWIDYRLDHGLNDTISLGNTVLENIWLPDSYFLNAKKGYFHEVTSSNRMIMIAPEGLVKYNLRVTITTSCPLDLRKYPMDVQTCPLSVESYGYDEQHIRFKWEGGNGDGMRFVPNEEIRFLPQYKLQTLHLSTTTAQYVVGNFSSAVATFTFERTYNYFLTHIYGTSLVVVIISWMAFLIPREQAAARISLGITSVLTEVAILNMMNNSMPRVNYVKSIDKFLIGCFLFVFFTLIEYFLILALTMKIEKGKQKQAKAHNGKPAVKRGIQLSLNTLQDYKKTSSSTTVARNSGCAELSSTQENKCSGCNRSCWNWSTKPVLVESTVLKIEDYSLFLFPLCFSIFNAIYWAGYL